MGRIARLASTIEDLRAGLAGGRFQSEAEISQGVVKRILHDLGWDTFDVQVVKPEFKIESRMVDYALCQPPGSPAVLVEVKALGKADVKGQKQLFHYCFDQGVPIAVLTDGCEWHLFYTTGQGAYEDRLFARLNLIDDGFRDSATTLAKYLNREEVRSGAARKVAEQDYETRRQQRQAVTHFRVVWRRLLAGPDSLLLDLFREEIPSESSVENVRHDGSEKRSWPLAARTDRYLVTPPLSDRSSRACRTVPPKPKRSPRSSPSASDAGCFPSGCAGASPPPPGSTLRPHSGRFGAQPLRESARRERRAGFALPPPLGKPDPALQHLHELTVVLVLDASRLISVILIVAETLGAQAEGIME